MLHVIKPGAWLEPPRPRDFDSGDRVVLRVKDDLGQLWEIQTKVESVTLVRKMLSERPLEIPILDRS